MYFSFLDKSRNTLSGYCTGKKDSKAVQYVKQIYRSIYEIYVCRWSYFRHDLEVIAIEIYAHIEYIHKFIYANMNINIYLIRVATV